mgnify:CR=1 FL=1|jgi:hypothetical protein
MDKQTKLRLLEKSYRDLLDSGIVHTQKEFADVVGYNADNISSALSGNERFLTERMVNKIGKRSREIISNKILLAKKSEVIPKEYTGHIPVKVITAKSREGYVNAYYADEYLENMPTILIEADINYKARFLALEVDADFMEPIYDRGDVVICEEIPRSSWQQQLPYEEWDFVIAHGRKGLMIKEITSHNLETGEIECHSENSEAKPDMTLNLGDVAFLYKIIEHRRPGRKKRKKEND